LLVQFIDATYEGDLMAMAGVSYTVGREANSKYDETLNGFRLADHHQFKTPISPYRIPNDSTSGILSEISTAQVREINDTAVPAEIRAQMLSSFATAGGKAEFVIIVAKDQGNIVINGTRTIE